MSFAPVKVVSVFLDFDGSPIAAGRLASRKKKIYFEYDSDFLARQLNVSPLQLPLQSGVKSFDAALFHGLPGLFNDSLPDGWGRLLLDRSLRAQNVLPQSLSPLDRLAHVGRAGMGALVYEPDLFEPHDDSSVDLDQLSAQAHEVLTGTADDVVQQLLALNGSSAGARPKAMIQYDREGNRMEYGVEASDPAFAPWLVKFANQQDGPDAGAIEFVYAKMAVLAGIEIMETYLFPARLGAGYFATKRFDRMGSNRLHMHTACGLLHSDFRAPSLDYQDLLALTTLLTRDIRETEKMFRLAVFNVLAHNRDDHSKNFAFLMDDQGEWKLSPAYDLTFSSGPNGEQSTMVMGEGKSPDRSHLQKAGIEAGLKQRTIDSIMDQTYTALSAWQELASAVGVSSQNIRLIKARLQSVY